MALAEQITPAAAEAELVRQAAAFDGVRCNRIVQAVLDHPAFRYTEQS